MKATQWMWGRHTEHQTEADFNVLCERKGGGRGLNGIADWNSILVHTPNNSQLAAPGHLSPVKVVNLSRPTPNESSSLTSVYFTANKNKLKSEQASALIILDFRGFPERFKFNFQYSIGIHFNLSTCSFNF